MHVARIISPSRLFDVPSSLSHQLAMALLYRSQMDPLNTDVYNARKSPRHRLNCWRLSLP